MLNHTDSDEKITFGKLKKKLEKVTPLLIDIKHHIDPEEECIFSIIVESKKKSQRISKYFYHLGGVCYENTALNMGVETKSVEVVKNVKYKDNLKMKVIKYLDDSVSGLSEHVENFNELHNGDVSECQIGDFLDTAEKDKYGRFTTALEEIETAKIGSESEIDSSSSDYSENGSIGDGELSD